MAKTHRSSANLRRRSGQRELVCFLVLTIIVGLYISSVVEALSITTLGVPITQNFDTLPASGSATFTNDSTIPGWYSARTGTGTTIVANDGSSNAGNLYSYGTGTNTDRALGSVGSGNAAVGNLFWGIVLTNNTGSTITSLDVAYTGEQWRNSAAAAQTVAFSYVTGAGFTGSLAEFQAAGTNVAALDFTSPVTGGTAAALNGNLAANRIAISSTISGLSLANGQSILLRWSDPDHTGADHGLAIDDFSVTPNPVTPTNPSGTGAANPSTVAAGNSTLLTVTVTPGTNPPSTGLAVTGDLSSIGGSATQQFFDNATNGDVTAGDNIFSFQATVDGATTPGAKSLPIAIADAQARNGNTSISLTVQPAAVALFIHDIQGASHLSPFAGSAVSNVPGIVTAVRSNGFFMQDPSPDSDDATSEGIFVFTSSAPTVSVGDSVTVGGDIAEFRPGGASTTNLTITEITTPSVVIVSTGNALPSPIIIGTGGRTPPTTIIEDDAVGSVETSGVFDPATDGIDFYETLEGMRVQVNNAVAVGPTTDFGEITVVGDSGASASVRTTRGGIVVRPTDFNPERILLDDAILAGSTPQINVNDTFTTPVVGIMDYSFGNFKLLVTSALTAVSGGLTQETTATNTANQLSLATFNVENLDPGDGAVKFNTLANLIVINLKSPDLICLEEVQDNNGPTNDSVVDATTTYNTLISAIMTAGGPTYEFRQINPVDDQDGGEPGGNIRVGFLFRSDRGLSFIDRPGGGSTIATTVIDAGGGDPQLSNSPGRVDPTNPAFNSSRKPLVGEFTLNGQKFFVIANHFNSKGGDDPLFGRNQPPILSSETQRNQQAQIVNNFVDSILAINSNANVVVMGDINDFEFSTPVTTLKGGVLHALIESLPQSERYSYVFEGNSQTLDHILVSDNIFNGIPFQYDVVHVNSEFAINASDHDPSLVRLTLAPTAADAVVNGRITTSDGTPVEGAVVRLSGTQNRKFITDANGYYRFDNVETNGFYTVTPSRVNYSFNPSVRSFSQLGETTEATFGATTTGGFVNPLDTPEYFVRQHYVDFLGREPDEAGFNFWSDQILECGDDIACVERKRINVSAAYFLSIEFQQTGGLVDGLYRTSYGVRPQFAEFMVDTRSVAHDVVVGRTGWEQQLEANKQAFVNAFVQRAAFRQAYDNLSNDAYVDTLLGHTGVTFTSGEREALGSGLANGTLTRSDVLRSIAENERFVSARFSEAFVMMEYFGYLRRDPDASGYQYWLNKLNQFNGNFIEAELVKAFIVSIEYRDRFPR